MTEQAAARKVSCHVHKDGTDTDGWRQVAEECAVALSFSGSTEAVMMASPSDLEDFAIGFSLSEGIIETIAEIDTIEIVPASGGIDLQIGLIEGRDHELRKRRRAKAGPVGCGLCGVESIEEALRPVADVSQIPLVLSASDIEQAGRLLADGQDLNRLTRATHAAGFYQPGRGMLAVREDVGRHNALDKLIGHLARNAFDPAKGAIVMTSRLSVELVQKAAGAGCPMLLGISAPTGLAIDMAQKAGMTLIALVRGADFEIFTGADRIIAATGMKQTG